MLQYLMGLMASVIGSDGGRETVALKWSVATVLASAWACLSSQFDGYLSSPVVVWVSIFWALDWTLGSLLAWREHRYDPRRGLYSVVKWLIWMATITVCWGLRKDALIYDDWIPPIVEVTILLTEAASVMRNGAALMASISGRKEAGVLSRFGRAFERVVDQDLARRLGEIGPDPTRHEGPDEGPSAVPGGEA